MQGSPRVRLAGAERALEQGGSQVLLSPSLPLPAPQSSHLYHGGRWASVSRSSGQHFLCYRSCQHPLPESSWRLWEVGTVINFILQRGKLSTEKLSDPPKVTQLGNLRVQDSEGDEPSPGSGRTVTCPFQAEAA